MYELKVHTNFPAYLARQLRQRYGLRYFVETGTCVGATLEVAALMFDRAWTVEYDPILHRDARQRLSPQYPHVTFAVGESPAFLRGIARALTQPTLYWLDAHWTGSGKRPPQECPLLDELHAIGGLRGRDVVLIDDLNFFCQPPGGVHDPAQWPTYQQICEAVAGWNATIEQHDNVLAIVPSNTCPLPKERFLPAHRDIWSEVVTQDCYRLADVDFVPRYVLDIGANVGTFSAFASHKWPHARIAAVEPHPPTFETMRKLLRPWPAIVPINAGLGRGDLVARLDRVPGNNSYVSADIHALESAVYPIGQWESTGVPGRSLDYFARAIDAEPEYTLVKIDTEGAEHSLLDDDTSTEFLRRARWIVMELHPWDRAEGKRSPKELLNYLYRFVGTHDVTLQMVAFSRGMATLRRKADGLRMSYDFQQPMVP